MSFVKVILNWRPDLYVKLNSNFTVNLATFLAAVFIGIDILMRIDLHIFNNCVDLILLKFLHLDLHREFCIPLAMNHTTNSTFCERLDQKEVLYPIGCDICASYPTLRILIGFLLLFEGLKFLLGFNRIVKKYLKKSESKKRGIKSSHEISGRIKGKNFNKVDPMSNSTIEEIQDARDKTHVTDGNVYKGPLYDDLFQITDKIELANDLEIKGLSIGDKLGKNRNSDSTDNQDVSSDVDIEVADLFENSGKKMPIQLDLCSDKLETSLTLGSDSCNYPTNFTVKVIVTSEPERGSLNPISVQNFDGKNESLYKINTISEMIDTRTDESPRLIDTFDNQTKEEKSQYSNSKLKQEVYEFNDSKTNDMTERNENFENIGKTTNMGILINNDEEVKTDNTSIESNENDR